SSTAGAWSPARSLSGQDMIARTLSLVFVGLTFFVGGCSDSSPSADTDAGTTLPPPIPGLTASADTSIKPPPIPAPPQIPAKGYYLVDYRTNQALAASNENERLEPASLTKLMSAYVVFHALKDGRIKLDDMVRKIGRASCRERGK